MKRAEIEKNYFYQGYACSQSIVMAFSDLVEIDKEQLTKISLPFGGGMGRLRLTCGAFSGMLLIVSLLLATDEGVEDNKTKMYAVVQELAKRFEKQMQTLNCNELLKLASLEVEIGGNPEHRTEQYYKKRPCGKIVYQACEILEQYLREKNIIG